MRPVDVFGVSGETVEQQEDVSAAGHPVANPWPLLQQALLPRKFPTPDTGVQVLWFFGNQISFGKQIGNSCENIGDIRGDFGALSYGELLQHSVKGSHITSV